MSEAVAALWGALVGGFASAVGGVVVAVMTARADERRTRREAATLLVADTRRQLAEVIRLTFAVEYRVFEAAWLARTNPTRLDREYAERYEAHMATLLPQWSGSLVVLAGLSPAVHAIVRPWTEELGSIEGTASRALIVDPMPDDLVQQLSALREPLVAFYTDAPERLAPAHGLLGPTASPTAAVAGSAAVGVR